MDSEGMRVAFVVTEFVTEPNFSGGLANYTDRMAISLLELGHTPEVFVLSEHSGSFMHKGFRVHRVQRRYSFPSRLLRFIERRALPGTMRGWTSLVASIHGLHCSVKTRHQEAPFQVIQYTHLLGVGLFRVRGAASVVRLSSYADMWIPYGFNYSSPFQRWLEDLALRRADAVVSPSVMVGEVVRKRLSVSVDVIESPFVPPNPAEEDDSVFREAWTKKVGGAARYGLYYGSLVEWKGVWVLLDALIEFLRLHPEMGCIFIGRNLTSKDEVPASERIAQQLSEFNDRVLISPALDHSKLYPFIRKADFVTLPSLMDNLPNTLIESMWLKKLVIGTRGRSFDQLIEHGKSGLLCDPGCVSSLLIAMNKAVSLSDDERNRIGQCAKKRIQKLSPSEIGRQYEALYQKLL